jgi:hypothetical protein
MIKTLKNTLWPLYKFSQKVIHFPAGFYKYALSQRLSATTNDFKSSLEFFKPKNTNAQGIVLVQLVKDYENTIKFATAAKLIAEQKNLEVHFYEVDWTSKIGWGSPYQKLYKRFFTPSIEKVCQAFGGKVMLDYSDDFQDLNFIHAKLNHYKSYLKTKEQILEIKFDSILVGDLIYDTYLRYFHQPTIEEINENVLTTIEIALHVFYSFSHFIEKNKQIKCLINVYSSYIDHGISARICLEKNIEVYTVGSYSYLIQQLKKDFPYHQINHTLFNADKQLSEAEFELAKSTFTARFEGKIDAATSYMRSSAFSEQKIPAELVAKFQKRKRNVVIYVHDFYDSPHVNRMLQFADLFQFLKQTLEALLNLTDTTIFIKIHPNGIAGCKEKTIELVESYAKKHFQILDETVSNISIINLHPNLIATARGTVCLEMAYFEIPTVALYDNLYTNFNFTHTCYDLESFYKIIRGEKEPEIDFNKEKIIRFYYQAFLEKRMEVKGNILAELAAFKGDTYNDKYLKHVLSGEYATRKEDLLRYYESALNQR